MIMHKDCINKYPDNSEIRRNKVEDLKRKFHMFHTVHRNELLLCM